MLRVRHLLVAAGVAGLLAVASASAGDQHQILLKISVTGKGTVRLSDWRRLACSVRCRKTFSLVAGVRVRLTTRAASGWAPVTWAWARHGANPTCALRPRRAARVAVTFAAPGTTRANPIPLGRAAPVGRGWKLTVVSAALDATAQIVAIPGNESPHLGAQYTMLNLSATYTGA